MRRMQLKMGKFTNKNSGLRNNQTQKRLSRDSCLDESNDSGFGLEFNLGLPESSSSSCLEESDVDSSSDSVDSGISCRHRRHIKAKARNLTSSVNSRNNTTANLSSPYSAMHIDTSLSLSLNHKMHLHHKSNGHQLIGHNEPPSKRRKILPVISLQEEKPRRLTIHNNYPSTAQPTSGVLTESGICGNSVGRNNYEDPLLIDLQKTDYSSRGGDHIAALLSPNSHALSRKKPSKMPSLHVPFPHISKDSKLELRILVQPEEQHRARYMTEGSRGSIKDEKGTGFPTVKLTGNDQPIILQVFIGCDQGKVQPHLFYQACRVTGKNCTPCSERVIDGTTVIEIQLDPANDMTASCDCIGILKERNVDVEQRLPYFGLSRCKKRSTKCRMVFRINVPLSNGSYETYQITSSPILCTQSPGLPEICKKSLTECSAKGGTDLFIIGKNFQKDARIVFTGLSRDHTDSGRHNVFWEESVEPEKEYIHQSHLVCSVPPYCEQEIEKPVKVMLSVSSGGKSSEPHIFTYTPNQTVYKDEFDRMNFEAQTRIHHVEIKREWINDSLTSDESSTSAPSSMGSASSMMPSVLESIQDCQGSRSSTNSMMSLNVPPLQHLISSSNVGSPFSLSSSSSMRSPISMSPSDENHSLTSSYSLMSEAEQQSSSVKEVIHHDVDLISGINQLATEIVNEQQRLTATQNHAVTCEVASNVNSLVASDSQFTPENCFTSASNIIKHEIEAFDLSSGVINADNNLFMLSDNMASTPLCSTVNRDGIVPNELYISGNDNLSQKQITLMTNEANSSLPKPSISMVNSSAETATIVGGEFPSGAICSSSISNSEKRNLVENCPHVVVALSQNNLLPSVVCSDRASNQETISSILIKNDKQRSQIVPATGQQNDMNGFHQSMTYAFSQLSDADLLSMINPNTFDSV